MLDKLATDHKFSVLQFKDCAACEADPKIVEISGIEDNSDRARRLFDYLEDWVPPVNPDALPAPHSTGFDFSTDVQGRLTLALARTAQDRQTAQLHSILTADVAELIQICPGGPNQGFGRVARMLGQYETALGPDPEGIVPAVLWNAGNKLRIELRSDAERSGTAMDDQPKLPGDLRDGLEGLVTAHNAFVTGHPDLVALDAARQDSIDRHSPEFDPARIEAFLRALEGQTRLIVQEVFDEFRVLHEQTV